MTERPEVRRSKGGATHRRRQLAEQRKEVSSTPTTPSYLTDSLRIRELEAQIDSRGVDPNSKAAAQIEVYWRQARLKKMSPRERQSSMDRYLNCLEQNNTSAYDYLLETVAYDELNKPISRMMQIRDRVLKKQ